MFIQKKTFEMGNDYTAVMECEHCHKTQVDKRGYDDANYHDNVIPAMHCESCGKDRAGKCALARTDVTRDASVERAVDALRNVVDQAVSRRDLDTCLEAFRIGLAMAWLDGDLHGFDRGHTSTLAAYDKFAAARKPPTSQH